MIKLCVSGSKGKMGSRISEIAKEDKRFELSGQFDEGEDPKGLVELCDCLIEFTSPEATVAHAQLCAKLGKPVVIGTTGLSDEQKKTIDEAAKSVPVVMSPNMSVGVNLLFKMVADAAKTLGKGYSIDIVEAHHTNKKDSPSGTAKELERLIKKSKPHTEVHTDSIREGEIVGEHTVTFDSDVDMIEITHSAKTRDIFAHGALEAAHWLVGKSPGLYTMRDVLGL